MENVDERREQRRLLRSVELDPREDRFELGEPTPRRHLGTSKTGLSPPQDRMQRRVLQELRRTPLDPRVWRLAELASKLFDKPGLADAGLPDNQDKLPFTRAGAFPTAGQDTDVLFAADERRRKPGALPPTPAAYAQNPIERHRRRDALEFVRALVFNDEESGDLPLDGRSDEYGARLGGGLNTRRNIGRFAEYLASGVNDDGTSV